MARMFEGRVKCKSKDVDEWKGCLKGGCSGREWQGKVLKGALKGVNFCRGHGVWGTFLHGAWKGWNFR